MKKKGINRKGSGVSGGGLAARISWYNDNAAVGGGMMPNGNGVRNMKYHRPGSQNPSKGGVGK